VPLNKKLQGATAISRTNASLALDKIVQGKVRLS